jgi:hypothetical protein
MNFHKFSLTAIIFLTCMIIITACSPQPSTSPLTVEEHALASMGDLDLGDWTPVEGTRVDILAKHAAERGTSAAEGVSTLFIGADTLRAVETYEEKYVSVEVTRNDQQIFTTKAGVISPINNCRGLWAVDDQWIMEVAHVEEDANDPNAAFIIWGEIIRDGESLNQKHGYDEAFGFQLLDAKPFFFFKKDGQIGMSYDGKETPLNFTEVSHYLCCSAGSLNPRSAEKMVAFFAKRDNVDYYVEIGVIK